MHRKQEREEKLAKILNCGVGSKLLCAMDDVGMRALEDRAEWPGPQMRNVFRN